MATLEGVYYPVTSRCAKEVSIPCDKIPPALIYPYGSRAQTVSGVWCLWFVRMWARQRWLLAGSGVLGRGG